MMFKVKYMVVIAFLFSGLTTFGIYRYIQSQKDVSDNPQRKMQEVVVAKASLPIGKKIETRDVCINEWPSSIVPDGVYTQLEDVVGRVIKLDIFTGETIMEAKLAPIGSE